MRIWLSSGKRKVLIDVLPTFPKEHTGCSSLSLGAWRVCHLSQSSETLVIAQ